MAIDKEIVKYLAHLSRIKLEPKELEKLSRQLQDIVDFIDKLKKVDISEIEPTSHILPISNVLREDSARTSLPRDKVLENAPQRHGDFFSVPRVIE
ncbi:MAG: Asp-tRNA(Asn)/Glu-tRNA(Gln) amidotransferase subunit GatC [Candidatus Omnitrophica bacterium]|nr:Asp-tRNA(Asn)/Glu-tRNA(Gln) amidotransferase subunit GatC [Candidatus Omnitrophota bacterium]